MSGVERSEAEWDAAGIAAMHAALKSVAMLFPHLSGLARLVRVAADRRVGTAGIFASGRLLLNPEWLQAKLAATDVTLLTRIGFFQSRQYQALGRQIARFPQIT